MAPRHLYLTDSALSETETHVIAVRELADGVAIAVLESLYRPAGGGEPADRGQIALPAGGIVPVARLEKADGLTWLVLPRLAEQIVIGTPLTTQVDGDYRDRKRKLHTLVHALLAAAARRIDGLNVEAADISLDATKALVVATSPTDVPAHLLAGVDQAVRSVVVERRPVLIDKAKSLEETRGRFGKTFRLSERHQLRPHSPDRDLRARRESLFGHLCHHYRHRSL